MTKARRPYTKGSPAGGIYAFRMIDDVVLLLRFASVTLMSAGVSQMLRSAKPVRSAKAAPQDRAHTNPRNAFYIGLAKQKQSEKKRGCIFFHWPPRGDAKI